MTYRSFCRETNEEIPRLGAWRDCNRKGGETAAWQRRSVDFEESEVDVGLSGRLPGPTAQERIGNG